MLATGMSRKSLRIHMVNRRQESARRIAAHYEVDRKTREKGGGTVTTHWTLTSLVATVSAGAMGTPWAYCWLGFLFFATAVDGAPRIIEALTPSIMQRQKLRSKEHRRNEDSAD